MATAEPKVLIPGSVLKKRKREEQWALARQQELAAKKKKSRETRKIIFARAQKCAKEYETQENELVQSKREARTKGGFYVSPEPDLLFIIRIPVYSILFTFFIHHYTIRASIIGFQHLFTPRMLPVLALQYRCNAAKNSREAYFTNFFLSFLAQKLILFPLQIFNVVFLKVNKTSMSMLRRMEHHVTYGYPNLESAKELTYKRGYGNLNKQRIPLAGNSIIEEMWTLSALKISFMRS